MRNDLRLVICCVFALAAGGALAESYEVGQIWSYQTRPQEPQSALVILRIDNSTALGEVIFIRLINLNFQGIGGPMIVQALSPLPFTRAALDRSVVKLIGKTSEPNSSDTGYKKWKQAQLEGKKVALYTRPVAAVVNDLEARMLSGRKEPEPAAAQSR